MSERNLKIRPYVTGSRVDLIRLWSRAFPDDTGRNAPELMLENKLKLGDSLILVAFFDQALVGAIMGGYDGVRGWLYHLAVAEEYRRRGIGAELVREAELRLKALGCVKVNLQVRASNSEVARFYASVGYAEEARVSMGRVL